MSLQEICSSIPVTGVKMYLSIFCGCATRWHLAPAALGIWRDTAARDHWEEHLLLLRKSPLAQRLPAPGPLHIVTWHEECKGDKAPHANIV